MNEIPRGSIGKLQSKQEVQGTKYRQIWTFI